MLTMSRPGSFRINRRGLSPIFATLIILGVVTVLFVPVFIWASNLTSQTTDSWNTSGKAATERIIIEEVNLHTGQTTKIYIRNIGQSAVIINDILISPAGGTGTIHPYDHITTNTANNIYADKDSAIPGDLITITIKNIGFTLDQPAYTVQAFTTLGVGNSYLVKV